MVISYFILTMHNGLGVMLLLLQTILQLTILALQLLDALYQTGMWCSLLGKQK